MLHINTYCCPSRLINKFFHFTSSVLSGGSCRYDHHVSCSCVWVCLLLSPDMCGGVLTGLSGVIASPGYPEEYSNNADCSWTVHVSNTSVVTFVFLDFQLENNEGCNFDFVALFDGPTVTHRLLGKFCGADKPPNIVTTSNQLLVVFKSDFNIGGRGFKAYYYSGTTV